MKRKLVKILTAVLLVVTMAFGLTACDINGLIDGKCKEHKEKWVIDQPATCNASGIKHSECETCGKLIQINTIQALDHNYGEWIIFGSDTNTCEDKTFYRVCEDCNQMQFKKGAYADHDWNVVSIAPTCQSQGYDHKTCKICGTEQDDNYVATVDHDWQSEYSADNSFHWIKCNDCVEIKDKVEHTTDGSGYCTVCDNPIGATEGILYDLSADGTYAEVIGYEGSATRIVIASEYKNKPVKSIYNNAFSGKTITSVIIPDGVQSIGDSAFIYCRSLTSVVIPDSVQSIGSFAFCSCDRLKSIDLPSNLQKINNSTFQECYSLTSIVIPDGVQRIDSNAFSSCSSLTSVVIPDSVQSIGEAFPNCNSALYTIENNLKYVKANGNDYYILVGAINKNLSTYQINANAKHIGGGTFYEFERLTNIVIPDGVQSIGAYAFSNCSSLSKVYYKGSASDWDDISIDSSNVYLTSATRYYYIENEQDLPNDGGNYWHYVDCEPTAW